MNKSYDKLQELYRNNTGSVRGSFYNETSALQIYNNYTQFVHQSAPPSGLLLDVGCGSGWSSYVFSKLGYETVGVDLNPEAFEPAITPNLTLREGSALALPFSDNSFDIVATYQMIEHVPDPQLAVLEMLRVLKPNGILCIVSPNLLSIGLSIQALGIHVWKNRPVSSIFLRRSGMPKHPFGNTLFEVITIIPTNLSRILLKLLSKEATFTMREPDLIPPFHADNDACYVCNPIDFIKFLPTQGCEVIKNGNYGRLPLSTMLAGGTYIAARKLGNS